jgi:hypothetical protein
MGGDGKHDTIGMVSESRILARENHYMRHLGPMTEPIAHSSDKQPVHLDIYQFGPNASRPYWKLVTGGMSDLRQNIPIPVAEFAAPRAELLMYATEPQPWMFSILKTLAEYPSRTGKYLHWLHTWTNDAPLTTTPSEYTSCLFLPPRLENSSFNELQIEGDRVDFLWMIPITSAERDYAAERGSEHLEWLFVRCGVDLIASDRRVPVV